MTTRNAWELIGGIAAVVTVYTFALVLLAVAVFACLLISARALDQHMRGERRAPAISYWSRNDQSVRSAATTTVWDGRFWGRKGSLVGMNLSDDRKRLTGTPFAFGRKSSTKLG